jgi:chemotaxis protein histidine kinase CheA
MAKINEDKLDAAIDFIEELSDKAYESFLDTFEKEQPELFNYLNERLEDLETEDQQNDVITIMMIILKALKEENPDMFIISTKVIEECARKHEALLEEIEEISRTNELLGDEDLSMSFIPNRALHNFVTATLDPNEEDSPFDDENSEKAYHIIKICVDSIAEVV